MSKVYFVELLHMCYEILLFSSFFLFFFWLVRHRIGVSYFNTQLNWSNMQWSVICRRTWKTSEF